MSTAVQAAVGVREVVPFLQVRDMAVALAFYRDGLGFVITQQWTVDGGIRWCRIELGGAALMLQQFAGDGPDARSLSASPGDGVTLVFICDDALAVYRQATTGGIEAREPQVGNAMWVTSMTDPDGYRIDFESLTDAPEEITLTEFERSSEGRSH